MSFTLNYLQRVILFLTVYSLNVTAVNVTIYSNDSSITYSPSQAWATSAPNPFDLSGTHRLTQTPNATASFNFTGIAVYFLSPLWPYTVNTAVSLDSGNISLIDLQDHSRPNAGQGSETVQSQVVWSATGLANTQHSLVISVGAGQPYAIVDALMYTNATNVTSSSSLSPTPTSHDPIIASSTEGVTPSPKSKSKSVVAIALGSLFGIFGLLVVVGGVWYFCRRRKRPTSEAWTVDGAPHAISISRHTSMSAFRSNYMENWNAEQLYHNGTGSIPQPGTSWHNPIHSRTAIGRMPDRYEPGHTLSTITERSTPQMTEGRAPLATAPPSYDSEAEYYTAVQGSEASHSVSRLQQQQPPTSSLVGAASPIQGYPYQQRNPSQHKSAGNWI